MIEAFLLALLQAFCLGLSVLPRRVGRWAIVSLLRIYLLLNSRLRRTAYRNLEIAFPNRDRVWREGVIHESLHSLARLILDLLRLPKINKAWLDAHLLGTHFDTFAKIRAKAGEKGVIIVTGHLGSFEIFAQCLPLNGYKLDVVARGLKQPKINAWLTKMREQHGNRIISRQGAFREVLSSIKSGTNVALLFDQNVTSRHGVFVDFFGVPACTTKTPALAAIRTGAPLMVAALLYSGGDSYRVRVEECEISDLLAERALDQDELVREITARLSKIYEGMVRESPGEWFWLHRRWKTRPEGEARDLYSSEAWAL